MTEAQEIAHLRARTINHILSAPDDNGEYSADSLLLLHDSAIWLAVTGVKELPIRVFTALKDAVGFYKRALDARIGATSEKITITNRNIAEHISGLFELNQSDSHLLAFHLLQFAKEQRKVVAAQTAEQPTATA